MQSGIEIRIKALKHNNSSKIDIWHHPSPIGYEAATGIVLEKSSS